MLTVLDSPSIHLAQEAERLRIARELHDSVLQSLSALVADLEHFQTRHLPILNQTNQEVATKVDIWQELARASLTSMRQVLGELRQPCELDLGLEQAIQTLLSQFRASGWTVIFSYDALPDQLPTEYVSHIYYIVRESLTNINKHAQATSITVNLSAFDDYLHIVVRDNGIGMNVQSAASQGFKGYQQGLLGVRERVACMNGKLNIESIPGRGTCVDVSIPTDALFKKLDNSEHPCHSGLTKREMKLLVLIAKGMRAKEIARELSISEKTVHNHTSSIYRKLNLYNRSQLAVYAMRNGLITDSDNL